MVLYSTYHRAQRHRDTWSIHLVCGGWLQVSSAVGKAGLLTY